MKLYQSDCFQDKSNKIFPHQMEIKTVDDLRKTVERDHMFSAVKDGIREKGKTNFIRSNCFVGDIDNEHSDNPDDWIQPDDISDAFDNDVKFWIVFSRNHMREKGGKSPRPRFHVYCQLSQEITNYDDFSAFAQLVCGWFPFFDRVVITHPTQFIFGVKNPEIKWIDGEQTIDQIMSDKTDDQIEAEKVKWLEHFSSVEEGYDPDWIESVRKFLDGDEEDFPEIDDPQLDSDERDNQCEWFESWAKTHSVVIRGRGSFHDNNHWHAKYYVVDCHQKELHTVEGKNDTKIIVDAGPVPGRINFKCWHDHCVGATWEDFRAAHDRPFELKLISRKVNLRKVPKRGPDGKTIMVPVQSSDNMAAVLREDPELAGRIRFDAFSCRPRYEGQLPWRPEGDNSGEWVDSDDAFLAARMHTVYGLKGRDIFEDSMRMILFENRFNPVVDYLEHLPEWDGVDRIADLLPDFLGAARTAYNAAVMRLTMLQGVARIYRPGCKADHVPVLVGRQGIGKSEFAKRLAKYDSWYDGNFNTLDGREAAERLRGKWICELSELLAMKRAKEVEAVKSFITTQVDSYREPYSRHVTDHPRFCIFVATTNEESFLSDRTGNRRFLPVRCGVQEKTKSLFDADAQSVFDMAWSQALHEYKKAEGNPALILPDDVLSDAEAEQAAHLEEDPRVGVIQKYLDEDVLDRVCVLEIWHKALHETGQPTGRDSRQIHSIMRNDIKGWREDGQQRFAVYGQQRAYRRFSDAPEGFELMDEDIPF